MKWTRCCIERASSRRSASVNRPSGTTWYWLLCRVGAGAVLYIVLGRIPATAHDIGGVLSMTNDLPRAGAIPLPDRLLAIPGVRPLALEVVEAADRRPRRRRKRVSRWRRQAARTTSHRPVGRWDQLVMLADASPNPIGVAMRHMV